MFFSCAELDLNAPKKVAAMYVKRCLSMRFEAHSWIASTKKHSKYYANKARCSGLINPLDLHIFTSLLAIRSESFLLFDRMEKSTIQKGITIPVLHGNPVRKYAIKVPIL